jgi:tripartite-type tricarboxylate transporter receptor subunit TctC
MKLLLRRNFLKLAGAIMAMPALPQLASALDYPTRPTKIVAGFAAGGGVDITARLIGQWLNERLGQSFVVENRTGAGGTIGMDAAMKSAPDGYTVLITNDNAASAPHIMNLSYDYTKELLPICYLGRQSQFLAVHGSLGVNTVKELVEYVKKNPGLSYASSGVGSNQHVAGEWFAKEAGIKMEHVPYRGAGQAINDLIAAHVKTAFLGPTALFPHYKAGTVKLLGHTGSKRSPILPEIPTLDESGYKVVLDAWYAAFVPSGTPAGIIAKLNSEMNKALKDPKLLETFKAGAVEPIGGTPDEIGKIAQADSVKYARLVKELNIKTN